MVVNGLETDPRSGDISRGAAAMLQSDRTLCGYTVLLPILNEKAFSSEDRFCQSAHLFLWSQTSSL
jgi:hypothetical protein